MAELVSNTEILAETIVDIPIEKIDDLNKNAWEIRRSDLRTSWRYANTTEKISIIKSYEKGLAESLLTLAYCLWRFGETPLALEKSTAAIKLFQLLNNKKGEADALNIMGAILFMHQGDNESRLKYNQICLQLRIDINDTEGIAGSENHIGETFMDLGDFTEANKWFTKCLNNPSSTIQFQGWAHHNIGIIFYREKKFKQAIVSLYNSLRLSDSVKYDLLSISNHLFIAKALIGSDIISNQVDFHLNIALNTSIKSGIKEERNKIYLTFSEIEEKRGNIEKAFKWFKKYNSAHNELFNELNNQKVNNMQIQHKIEAVMKEAEFERIKHSKLQALIEQINIQKEEIFQKNIALTDSINYAKHIQQAAMTPLSYIKKYSPIDFFIHFTPKDIVSGDFYWVTKKGDKFYFAVCDSTGHGVPGAYMSLLNISYLHAAIKEKNIVEPNHIFDYVRKRIIEKLSHEDQKDGMDGVLLCIDYSTKKITYAASYNAPIIIRNNEIIKLDADKMPVGQGIKTEVFKCYNLDYIKGDTLYLYTDGFADQFGGDNGKKFMKKNLLRLMAKIAEYPINQQSELFQKTFDDWHGTHEQVDDITIVGFKFD